VGQVIGRLGLAARLGHRPSELSGGQQQRVACARALITQAGRRLADEPTGNLDSASGAEVLGFLRASVRELGQTVIMVTHDPVAAATPTGWCSSPTDGSAASCPAPTRVRARSPQAGRE
jgi:putative ABC transport system ATP-binding protein